ncbi:MAG: hypothetical protein OXF56_02590 [Rhodobacteraceae bacterium]|nr:hypothetical protein [Paracoccaceae bacterium]
MDTYQKSSDRIASLLKSFAHVGGATVDFHALDQDPLERGDPALP